VIIDGGQTNNPSVDAFIEAFRSLDAEYIIVLPDNSNVVLTAQQAASIYQDADVRVIPTKSIAEGCSALSMFNPWCSGVEELMEQMTSGLSGITTGLLTTAIRDTNMNGLDIKKGNYIGLDRETILTCGEDKVDTAFRLIQTITEANPKSIFIVFTGADVTEEEAQALQQRMTEAYPYGDVGFVNGQQEIYDFVISLE
jgi:dihydroxyacetone kinase-like predicted kinase